MIVYPAIDLRTGVCVRLMHGRFDAVTRYDDDPAARLGPVEVDDVSPVGPDHITLAIDVKADGDRYIPALRGWTEAASIDLWAALDRYPPGVAKHLLVTDVGRDGALTGPNLDLLAEIHQRRPDLWLQASGGVADLSDLTGARSVGATGAIVGRALYEGRFTLEQALETARS